jgi:hypothetical protein
MEKICIVNQPQGLGDILYVQKIVKHFFDLGYKIIFPIIKNYMFCNTYLGNDKIQYLINTGIFLLEKNYKFDFGSKDFIFTDNFVYLPLSMAAKHPGYRNLYGIMGSKYRILNIDSSDYNSYIKINRNSKKEKYLYDALNLKGSYIVVNKIFSNPSVGGFKTANFEIHTNKKVVPFNIIDGYSIFDWCQILENAEEIHTVETSLIYLLDSIDINIKCKIFIYAKREDSFFVSKNDRKKPECMNIIKKPNFM